MIKNMEDAVSEIVQVNRDQIEHRALWMGLIFEEMRKAGLDAEKITRAAIRKCGIFHGNIFKENCKDKENLVEFRKVFPPDIAVGTFYMNPITADRDSLKLDFNYCALVSAWQKLGFDDETCALLCDIAMEGDRGIAEAMGYKLVLTDTIAKGCSSCKLEFVKA